MAELTRSTEAGTGYSNLLEAFDAGAAAAAHACASLSGPPSCCLVFATTGYDPQVLLAGIRSVIGGATLAGCSGEGVISGTCSDERRAVTVLAIRSTSLRFEVAARDDYGAATEPCARALAAELRAGGDADLAGVIVLTDGLFGDCSRFLAAFQAALPKHTVVVGGCAADDMAFERTYQYAGAQVLSAGVVAVAVRGAAELRVSVSHGCVPIGLPSTITRARDGWLLEIDGRPAWDVMRDYLGAEAQDLNAEGMSHLSLGRPLVPERTGDDDSFVVRIPTSLDPVTGALFFPGGGLVEGERVRIMRRDQDRIRRSAEQCAQQLSGPRPPSFVLQFDCAGRGRVMFGNCVAEEVVQPLQRALPGSAAWVGLHTFGEIAPLGESLHYHNYTVALCAVYG